MSTTSVVIAPIRDTLHTLASFDYEAPERTLTTGSPADKIMQRLVREGGAVPTALNEKYFSKRRGKQKPYH